MGVIWGDVGFIFGRCCLVLLDVVIFWGSPVFLVCSLVIKAYVSKSRPFQKALICKKKVRDADRVSLVNKGSLIGDMTHGILRRWVNTEANGPEVLTRHTHIPSSDSGQQ